MSSFPIAILVEKEIDLMRAAGKVAADLLGHLGKMVKPGVSTLEINDEAERWVQELGHVNAPLGYKGFPKSICTSVNEVVCHGIPDADHILKDGDIINIDVTPIVNDYHGDTSAMFMVGEVTDEVKKLIEVTQRCLYLGIQQVKPGGHTGDIGAAILAEASKYGYGIVRDFTGHGIGRIFHTAPAIYHVGARGHGTRFEPGMAFTIEPMINLGTYAAKTLSDGWTAVTTDGKFSAQFEHTIVVTDDGAEILTLRSDEVIDESLRIRPMDARSQENEPA